MHVRREMRCLSKASWSMCVGSTGREGERAEECEENATWKAAGMGSARVKVDTSEPVACCGHLAKFPSSHMHAPPRVAPSDPCAQAHIVGASFSLHVLQSHLGVANRKGGNGFDAAHPVAALHLRMAKWMKESIPGLARWTGCRTWERLVRVCRECGAWDRWMKGMPEVKPMALVL